METQRAVRARRISKCFGDIVALDRVDLDLAQGQIHGLAGPNGAGKTTLLGLLLGLAVPDGGELQVLGRPVGKALAPPRGVAGFVDGPGLYPTLTARQNLAALADLRGGDGRTGPRRTGPRRTASGRIGSGRIDSGRIDEVLHEVGLAEVAGDRIRGFSLGMRQRLGLAAALLTGPRLLVLDEPANGLDPAGKKQVHAVLTRLAAEGTTVLLSSHRMDDLDALCSEVTILATGRVRFSGPLDKLADDKRELDYRLLTSDPAAARRLAAAADGVTVVPAEGTWRGAEALVVRAPVAAMDHLVAGLVRADVAVRELAPVISPLEAAFLALTEEQEDDR